MKLPTDLGLPFPAWRPGQWETVTQALRLRPGEGLFVEAPTGFGKSALPAALAAMGHTTTVLVAEKRLQAQYESAFPFAAVVWGKNNYPCANPQFYRDFTDRYGYHPSVEECAATANLKCDFCPYWQSVYRAQGAAFRVLNYHYAFYASWWRQGNSYVVLDEAHRVEDLLRDLVQATVSTRQRLLWDLPPFPQVRGSGADACVPAAEWLRQAKARLQADLNGHLSPADKVRVDRWANHAGWLAANLELFPDDWYVSLESALTIRPVSISRYASLFTRLRHEHPKALLMSATIGPPEVMAKTLDVQFFQSAQLPHPIPQERRPVYFVSNAPGLRNSSKMTDYETQARLILDILAQHPHERCLIHTSSWRHAHLLEAQIRPWRQTYLPTLDVPPDQQVHGFVCSPPGTVCISPSFWEGVDLPGDDCRVAIVAKVPFADLSDPVTALLLRRPGGRAWYDWRAAIKVVQGCGRIVRHEEDFGTAYIVDGNWRRVARLAPAWFSPTKL